MYCLFVYRKHECWWQSKPVIRTIPEKKACVLETLCLEETDSMHYSTFRCHLRVYPGNTALSISLLARRYGKKLVMHQDKAIAIQIILISVAYRHTCLHTVKKDKHTSENKLKHELCDPFLPWKHCTHSHELQKQQRQQLHIRRFLHAPL